MADVFRQSLMQVWRALYRCSITEGLRRVDLDREEATDTAPDASTTLHGWPLPVLMRERLMRCACGLGIRRCLRIGFVSGRVSRRQESVRFRSKKHSRCGGRRAVGYSPPCDVQSLFHRSS